MPTLKDKLEQAQKNRLTDQYQLHITITRHGPKDGIAGALTTEGKESVLKHYQDLYNKNERSEIVSRKLVSSPVHRALETANIYKNVLESQYESLHINIEQDDRLSEKDLVEFIENLPETKKDDWFRYWYYSSSGNKVIGDFCDWIREQFTSHEQSGGLFQVDAFSHGPLMAGFVLRLEDMLGRKIISEELSKDERLDFANLFSARTSLFNYLGTLEIFSSSEKPENFILRLNGKDSEIPKSILNHI